MSAAVHKDYLPGATKDLGAFVAGLKFEALPASTVAHTKLCILDSLACAIFGSTLPWTRKVADLVMAEGSTPRASLIGMGKASSAAGAVLVNSTACHAYELDDIHKLAMFHPGSINVPVALALAEAGGGVCDGRKLVTAIVAGYEVSLRAGIAATMALFFRGYHPQGVLGVFTSGATAARMLDLNAEQSHQALGIAGTQAAGLMAAQEGSMVKRMHSGRSAQSGVYAALLAQQGFTGISDVLEAGYGGFLSTISGDPKAEKLTEGLGKVWETENVGFKPHACVTSIHTSLDALRELMRDNNLKPDDVAKLDVGLSPMTHLHCAWEYKAQGETAAQMNLFYGLGAIAVDGEAFVAQYRKERLTDPRILDFIKRVNAHVDPEIEAMGAPGRHAVTMVLHTRDGRALKKHVYHRRGSPENPLTEAEVQAKFMALTRDCIGESRATRIIEQVRKIDKLDSLKELTGLLAEKTNA